jgi:hypothetical protein
VPRRVKPIATGQQPQTVLETCGDLVKADRRDPYRGELDRQRNPVQVLADLDDPRGLVVAQD